MNCFVLKRALAVCLLMTCSALAKDAAGPLVVPAAHFARSPTVRDLNRLSPASRALKAGAPREIPLGRLPRPEAPQRTKAAQVDPVVQQRFPAPSMPAALMTFEGISNLDGVYPPDCNGDVGLNHYVEMVNLHLCIYDKVTGTNLVAPFLMSSLYAAAGFGAPASTADDGDPVVLYDHLAHRWMISQFIVSVTPCHEVIAISQTSDPTGAWFLYDFVMPNTKMNDYPHFGVWPDAYYMTDNQFSGYSWGGAGVFAFDRARMLVGDTNATYQYFDLYGVDANFGGMLPADLDGPPPPAGTPCPFAMVDDSAVNAFDAMYLWSFHVDWTNASLSTFGSNGHPNTTNAVAPFDSSFSGGRNNIPQPDTAQKLDVLADRLMHRVQYRNFGTHETLVAAHTVDVDTDHAGVRYYQFRRDVPGGSFDLADQATFAPDSAHRWMGSAAMDGQGNLAVGYSCSSTSIYPSIRYAGRLSSDPTGGLFQGEAVMYAGAGSQTGSGARWGDYTMLSVDPADEVTFWYVNEYYPVTASVAWHTRIGSFRLGSAQQGVVRGVVTNALTGELLSGALVVTSLGYSSPTQTNGVYTLALATGQVNLAASAVDFETSAVVSVEILLNTTTEQNFALSPIPMRILPKTGLAASGMEGGPFIPSSASYSISNASLDALVWTAQVDVAWVSLSGQGGTLAAGSGTTLVAALNITADFLGTGVYSGTLVLSNSTAGTAQSRTLSLAIALRQEAVFCEDFSAGLPGDWVVLTNAAQQASAAWQAGSAGNLTGGADGFAWVNDDAHGSGVLTDTELIVAPFNLAGLGNPVLEFKTDFNFYESEVADVEVSTQGPAGPWSNVWSKTADYRGTESISLSPWLNQTNVQVRFHYNDGGGWGYWWQVDDVCVKGTRDQSSGDLGIKPQSGLEASGYAGGPFAPDRIYRLTNAGPGGLMWGVYGNPAWLSLSASNGLLMGHTMLDVTASVQGAASTLATGSYAATLVFSNITYSLSQTRPVALTVLEPLNVTPPAALVASGLEGGPFTPSNVVYVVSNGAAQAMSVSITHTQAWLTLSSTGGTLAAGAAWSVTGVLVEAALTVPGLYVDTIAMSNAFSGSVLERAALVTVVEIRGDIAVYDSVAPTNDLFLPFGAVVPYTAVTQSMLVVNSDPPGGRDLTIQEIFLGYLAEDFSDGFAQGWREDVDADWSVSGSAYQAQAPGANFLTAAYTDSVVRADLSIAALCSRSGELGWSQGVALRTSADFDADGVGQGYLFVFDGTTYYGVFWVDGDQSGVLQGWSASSAVLSNQPNRLAASAEGTNLHFFINNSLVWSGADSRFATGRVALIGYSDASSQPAYSFAAVQVQPPLRPTVGLGRKQIYINSLEEPDSRRTGTRRANPIPDLPEDLEGPVVMASPGFTVAPYTITNLPALPVTLVPGGLFDFDVIFAPQAVGTNRNAVTLHSDDNEDPYVAVELTGRAGQGLITGLVTSLNSGLGLAGVRVTAQNGVSNWTAFTTASGGYRLPVLAGTHGVTAELAHYTTGFVAGVVVADEAQATVNLVLTGSELTYAPTGLVVTLNYGAVQTNTVWLTNSGPLDFGVEVAVRSLPGNAPYSVPAFTGRVPVSSASNSALRAPAAAKHVDGPAPIRSAPTRRLCYGIDMISGRLVSFYTDAPETFTEIGATGANLIPCVDFLNDDFTQLYALDADANQLIRLVVADAAKTVVGSVTPLTGQSWTGLAAAPDGTLYAASTDGSVSQLYSLNPATGAATSIGAISGAPIVIAIACDAQGQLYGLDLADDNLVRIDAATGAGTVVGSVGFDANYAQGMDFDAADNVLYLAAYNGTDSRGELRIADTTTGNSELVGIFEGNAEMCIAVVAETAPTWLMLPAPTSMVGASSSSTLPVVLTTLDLANVASTNRAELLFAGGFVNAVSNLPVTLIVIPDDVGVTPEAPVTSEGAPGGPFTPSLHSYVLTNRGVASVIWTVTNDAAWITLSSAGGTLSAGGVYTFVAGLNAAANLLPLGVHTARLQVVNVNSGVAQNRELYLIVAEPEPDYFTELFTAGNDLDNTMLTFTPGPSAPYYEVCRSNGLAAFATDPAGGTTVSLGDDAFAAVTLSGGLNVPFYGVARTNLFIGSNGYLTFGSGSTEYGESLDLHFALPQLSLLFDDLNPSSGGTISWKQLADRVAVTWQNVPEYGESSLNSFQAELFTNGVVRLTWLDVAATDGLAGLSSGDGTPGDFTASDLSAYATCDSMAGGLLAVTNPAMFWLAPATQSAVRITGYADTNVLAGHLSWSNEWSGATGGTVLAASWAADSVPLAAGANVIRFTATNDPHRSLLAADHGANSAYADNWQDGDAGGSGWSGGWTLQSWSGVATFLITTNDPGNLSAGSRAWTLAASNGATAEARRELAQALSVGQTLHLRFDNNWIIEPGGYSVGFGLQNAASNNLFEWMFIGGTSTYLVNDSTNGRTTSIPWSGDGWDLSFTRTASDAYVFTCGVHVISGQLAAVADQAPIRLKFWNYSAGPTWQHNLYVNDIRRYGALPDLLRTSVVVVIVRPTSDSDADGMDDDWEAANGLSVGVNDATNNPDGDVWSNWQEFVADTNPLTSNEPLRVLVSLATNQVNVLAGPVTTNSRRYDLQATTNLLLSSWSLVQSNVTGAADGGVLLLPASNAAPGQALRVEVHLP